MSESKKKEKSKSCHQCCTAAGHRMVEYFWTHGGIQKQKKFGFGFWGFQNLAEVNLESQL